mmetsp:Transcript_12190/g.37024  ORF Transcript_12190/g.37024 Transcript_12190/m.37024 type:complete len:288 (-) Transcript_12190:521-1384(-)
MHPVLPVAQADVGPPLGEDSAGEVSPDHALEPVVPEPGVLHGCHHRRGRRAAKVILVEHVGDLRSRARAVKSPDVGARVLQPLVVRPPNLAERGVVLDLRVPQGLERPLDIAVPSRLERSLVVLLDGLHAPDVRGEVEGLQRPPDRGLRDDPHGHLGHDAQPAEVDLHRPHEVGVGLVGDLDQRPVRHHDLEAQDLVAQAAVLQGGAVGVGGDRTADGLVDEPGKGGERPPLAIGQVAGALVGGQVVQQRPLRDASGDADGLPLLVHPDRVGRRELRGVRHALAEGV